jgi:hypothetical protein
MPTSAARGCQEFLKEPARGTRRIDTVIKQDSNQRFNGWHGRKFELAVVAVKESLGNDA